MKFRTSRDGFGRLGPPEPPPPSEVVVLRPPPTQPSPSAPSPPEALSPQTVVALEEEEDKDDSSSFNLPSYGQAMLLPEVDIPAASTPPPPTYREACPK